MKNAGFPPHLEPVANMPMVVPRGHTRRWLTLAGLAVALSAAGALTLAAHAPRVQAASAPAPAAALTVTGTTAQRKTWPSTLEATGAIVAWQEASVAAKLAGTALVELRADVGDRVRRGQLLARFDTTMLQAEEAQLRAALAQARAAAAQAETNRQRSLQLKGSGGISEQDLLQYQTQADTTRAQAEVAQAQLAAKQLQLRYAEVLAPDDGAIVARSATLGAVPATGQELFRMVRQNRLEWHGELGAAQLAQVAVGHPVRVKLPDGSTARARVRQVAPSLDAQTRMGTVFAELDAGSPARPGMYASGAIELGRSDALAVPAASVVIRDGRSYVVLLRGDGDTLQAVLQSVAVGRRQGGEIEIVQGLSEGQRVAVQGAGFVNDGDRVRLLSASAPRAVAVPSGSLSSATAMSTRN
jgi:RND family efflux transporter MFP subunit